MFQPALDNLAGCGIQHGYLLEASMEITTYNKHHSAPFLRALVDCHRQVYSVGEPTTLSNQLVHANRKVADRPPITQAET
jgi:hypothetical protein